MKEQSGSVLFYILIAVALFATLGYVFSQNMNSTAGSLTKEEARVYAQDIIDYANRINRGVQRVLSNGCSENGVSFYISTIPALSGYEHASGTDDKCKVFHDSGGSVSWQFPAEGVNDGSDWVITGQNRVDGTSGVIGTNVAVSGNDLLITLANVNSEICRQINVLVKNDLINNAIPKDLANFDRGLFIGTYANTNTISDTNNVLQNKPIGCFEATNINSIAAGGTYHFYSILIAR